jgi:hypothetical protein
MLYWVYAVLGVCCTGCMLYWVFAVLSVSSCWWHGEIERDDLTLYCKVMVELMTERSGIRTNLANYHEKLGLRENVVWVNLPSPVQQLQVPICCVITPIQGLPKPIRQVVPLISYFHLYTPHHSHLHSPSLGFSSKTVLSLHHTKLSHPALSLHTMVMSWHWVQHTQVQHTPSTTYTKYSIHQVQHTPCTAYTKYNIHQVQHTPSTASTQDCLSFLHSHDYQLTPGCNISF